VESNQPLVSILINNYNYGHFLREAIDSALNQTYSNIEVIVVDDGSTDNSHQIIKNYGQKIIPILKENGGQASAFNVGFAASRGEIICFLDADDLFDPQKVEVIVQLFNQHPEVGWCFHPLDYQGHNVKAEDYEKNPRSDGIYDLRDLVTQQGKLKGKLGFGVATSATCYRRSLLEKILPMPEVIRITSDDYIKYLAFGLSPGFAIFKKLAVQRIHGNNAYTFQKDKIKLIIKIQVLTAYWIKTNFPAFRKFTNNILALSITMSWRQGNKEDENRQLIKNYLASANVLEIMEIYLRATYYLLKP